MFFDKLLDFLKLENTPEDTESLIETSGQKYSDPSFVADNPLLAIANYWSNNSNIYAHFNYRKANFKEKQHFAFISTLAYFSKSARDPDNFSLLILNELGITNWNRYFDNLLKKGYVQNANTFDILNGAYKLPELKTIADSLGIKKSGRKSELAKRISDSLSSSLSDEVVMANRNLYIISEKGKQKLVGNDDYILFYKYRHLVSLAEFNDMRIPDIGFRRRNFYDTMFQIFSNRKFFYQCQHDFFNAGMTSFHIYQLLMAELKKTNHNVPLDVALSHYVEYLYIQSCFCYSAQSALGYTWTSNSIKHYFLPHPDKDIQKLADFEPYLHYDMIFATNPPSFFTHNEFKDYIHDLLNAPMFDAQKWNSIIQKHIREYHSLIEKY